MLLLLRLMPSHREEYAALSKELDSTKAELLSLQTKRNKVSWCSTDIMESRMRLQELADCLKTALEEQVGEALCWGQKQQDGPGGFSMGMALSYGEPVVLHGIALRSCACWGSHKLHSGAVLSFLPF